MTASRAKMKVSRFYFQGVLCLGLRFSGNSKPGIDQVRPPTA